jgi:hypothetical protein
MSKPIELTNIYTNAPSPHPNLILGCFQLLFWLVFRPSAWKNHIQRLDPSLDRDFSLLQLFTRQRWRRKGVGRFLIQGFILLPILASFIIGGISFSLGTPLPIVAGGVAIGVAGGVAIGVAYGVVLDVAGGVAGGVAIGVAIGVGIGVAGGVAGGVARGVGIGFVYSLGIGFIYGLAGGMVYDGAYGMAIDVAVVLAGVLAFGVARGMAGVLVFGVAGCIGVWINWWRPPIMAALYVPWHTLLYRIDKNRIGSSLSLLSKHLAFWDELQYLPILGLDKHLLLVLDRNPLEGQAALDYLSTSRQRWAAQAAQIELDARQLEKCADTPAISKIYRHVTIGELSAPADSLFRSFNHISNDVKAALQQASVYNQRLAFTDIADRLNNLIRELTRSSDKYAVRFRPIAKSWQTIIALYIEDLIQETELRQEIDSPYIIGVPVTNRQQLFVGRTDISERLEQLIRDQRRPPLLLYGQRRTGKTSLLNNLGRLLPQSIIPLFVDLQGPATRASDSSGFLYNLAKGMIDSAQLQRRLTLPHLSRENLTADPFTRFDEWLDAVEAALEDNTALLALDEFEVLDRVLTAGRFNEDDVLGMLRHLIQHRPKFKVLLAGSHTLSEFQRWSSYLINAQVLHLGYLKENETRQLIETPIENFALRYQPAASQRVIDVTCCHPFLVQLLCAEIVAYKNDQDPSIRRLATLDDVEAAIPAALQSGSMFFSDIERNQLDPPAVAVLRYCAHQGEATTTSKSALIQQFPERLDLAIDLLLRRELIEDLSPTGYRIPIELIRRWFVA